MATEHQHLKGGVLMKKNIVIATLLAMSCLTVPLNVSAYNQFFDYDNYTVETEQFKYWNGSDYSSGDFGMRLETELTDANWMITGVFYEENGTEPYVYVVSPINQKFETRGNIYASTLAPFLEENQVLTVGDLFYIETMTAQETDPPIFSPFSGDVKYLGHGTDILGEDFMKVIRHELITEYSGVGKSLISDVTGVTVTKGDATEDDKVDILDVITINKTILGKETMNSYSVLATDINQNGIPDATDSLSTMKYVVGIYDSLES